MKALVTGGAGFIGSNIVFSLLSKGYEVVVYDDFSSGYFENIEDSVRKKDIQLIVGDVRDKNKVSLACKGVDVVFHLAASVGRQRSLDNPFSDSEINLLGTVSVLEGMKKNNVPKIIYSSSAAMFGELLTAEIDENHPQNADSPYGVSKLAAEKMILAYSGIYSITGICLRYFNIFGVNQRFDVYGNVIPIFAKRIFNREPIIIYGDGTQTRDFVNVKDVARANFDASVRVDTSDVFNIGSGRSITINYLAEIMQEISGIKVGIKFEPERPADVKHCKANANKILNSFGYKTEVKLEDGLCEYMKWFEKTAFE